MIDKTTIATQNGDPPFVNKLQHMWQTIFPNSQSGQTSMVLPKSKATLESLWRLEKIILDTLDFKETVQKICDSILTELDKVNFGCRIVNLCLIDEEKKVLKQISISQSLASTQAGEMMPTPIQEVQIPLAIEKNYCIKSVISNRPHATHDWADIFVPPYQPDDARTAQQMAGIKSSLVYPITHRGQPEGVIIFNIVKDETEVSSAERELIQSFTDVVGLAVQNSKLYTSREDLTEQLKRANTQLAQANLKLQELDKLKDEFVTLASHELRAPMTAIRGSLATILEGYAGEVNPQVWEFLTASYNENDRLIRLVNNLLNISRIESGRFNFNITRVDVDKIIEEVVNNLQPAAKERNIFLLYKKESRLPLVYGDDDKVKEVLINLVGNATKFTHKGGITVRAAIKDRFMITSVTDTGSGIAVEDMDRLFKKFSQVGGNYARPTGGTGLGLYICKQIVEGLQGKIWLDSTLGKGSTFYFSLPIAD